MGSHDYAPPQLSRASLLLPDLPDGDRESAPYSFAGISPCRSPILTCPPTLSARARHASPERGSAPICPHMCRQASHHVHPGCWQHGVNSSPSGSEFEMTPRRWHETRSCLDTILACRRSRLWRHPYPGAVVSGSPLAEAAAACCLPNGRRLLQIPRYQKLPPVRASRFRTFDTCHRPPRAVRTPRPLSATAIAR